MQIPLVFVRVCRGGFPLSESELVTAQGDVDIVPLIAFIVEANVNTGERKELRDFLDELLSAPTLRRKFRQSMRGRTRLWGLSRSVHF